MKAAVSFSVLFCVLYLVLENVNASAGKAAKGPKVTDKVSAGSISFVLLKFWGGPLAGLALPLGNMILLI